MPLEGCKLWKSTNLIERTYPNKYTVLNLNTYNDKVSSGNIRYPVLNLEPFLKIRGHHCLAHICSDL